MKPCRWYKRFINIIIDYFLIEFITIIFLTLLRNLGFFVEQKIKIADNIDFYTVSFFSFLFIFLLYYYLFELLLGKTVGKLITKTKVIIINKNRKKWITLIYRTISRILIFEIFWFFRKKPKGLHDIISNTLVVDITGA